ncbi:short chain dehydrogenase domain-containing protein [Sarocladium implicatum]|nr:short chain dehydrogenase domain-containing protein [Sarocladium implicatum]
MGFFNRKNHMPVEGKTVLMTGTSEGMGRCAVKEFAAKGANVIVVARQTDKLEQVVEEMKAAAKYPDKQRFTYIKADVGVQDYATGLIEEATRWNNGQPLDIVWSNAGFSIPRLIMDMPMEEMRRTMSVNYFGAIELIQAILRVWLDPSFPVEEQPRHLIVTVSAIVWCNVPGYATYAPSKGALRAFVDVLAQELMLYPQNVKLSMVIPGNMGTEGMSRENQTKPAITRKLEETDEVDDPTFCAQQFFKGLEAGRYHVTAKLLNSVMVWGAMGSSLRDNWIMDTLGMWLASLVYMYFRPLLNRQTRDFGKANGHPALWTQK